MATVEGDRIRVYEGSVDWSALYVDGKLVDVGDHYWIHDKLIELFGVEVTQSDDFMRGGDEREDVARTLEEIDEYQRSTLRMRAFSEARELEDQARTLTERAKELRATLDKG